MLTNDNLIPVFSIISKFKIIDFSDAYQFLFQSKYYDLTRIKLTQKHWVLEVDADIYEIYKTKGSRFSIFKNNKQIGGIVNRKIEYFNKSFYIYKTDDKNSAFLQLALFFASNFNYSSEDAAVTFDFDSPFLRAADESWFLSRFGQK